MCLLGQIARLEPDRRCHTSPIRSDAGCLADLDKIAQTVIGPLLAHYWRAGVSDAAASVPLSVAIQHPAGKLNETVAAWLITDARLRALRTEQPDDPATKILYATHLHSKYVACGPDLFMTGRATCEVDEAQIERLVLESLDFAQTPARRRDNRSQAVLFR